MNKSLEQMSPDELNKEYQEIALQLDALDGVVNASVEAVYDSFTKQYEPLVARRKKYNEEIRRRAEEGPKCKTCGQLIR